MLSTSSASGDQRLQFNRDIRPILSSHCYHCHGPDDGEADSDLRLDQQEGIRAAFGEMPVDIGQIAKIEFISKKGTVTEITLKNGDVVSGFLKDEDLAIDLDFGREVAIYQDRIEKIIFDKELLQKLSGEALKKAEEEKTK